MNVMREWPIAVRSVDIAETLRPLTGLAAYPKVRVFVSRQGTLRGSVDIYTSGSDTVSVDRLRDAIASRLWSDLLEDSLAQQLRAETPPPPPPLRALTISIVLPTCDREQDLRRCLESLIGQRTRHTVEIVLVDNRPARGTARRVARDFPGVRLVEERRRGLSFARNTGILHATGDIIVATDDDVVAPDDWLEKLVEPFARSEVMAVTGHVLPLELESDAQVRFEAYGGLGKGFKPAEFDGDWFRSRRIAVPTWMIGATANAAFRATIFRDPAIGLMDEALGAGMPTGCSEDTYLFYRILARGHTIVYVPTAYVWHRHRTSMASVRHQIYAYSKGHVAYHLTTWMRDGDRRALLRLFYSLPKTYLERAFARLVRRSEYPLSLILLEIAGNLAGPFALWRSRRRVARFGPSVPLAERQHAVSLEGPVTQDPAR